MLFGLEQLREKQKGVNNNNKEQHRNNSWSKIVEAQ